MTKLEKYYAAKKGVYAYCNRCHHARYHGSPGLVVCKMHGGNRWKNDTCGDWKADRWVPYAQPKHERL